jgi:thiol-disulfide isomerase/thioredoxin
MKNNNELNVILSKVAWCGHCTNFLPVFNKSQKLTKNNKYLKNTNVNFEVYDMEEDLEKFKSNNYEDLLPQINGYPTVIVTSLKNGKRVNTEIIDHSSDPLEFINTVGETYNKLVSQSGGFEEEEFYKQKYLKYKQKYTELKAQLGGKPEQSEIDYFKSILKFDTLPIKSEFDELITKLKEERRGKNEAYAKTWKNFTQEDLNSLTNLMTALQGNYAGDKVKFKIESKEYTFVIKEEYIFKSEKLTYKNKLELIKKRMEDLDHFATETYLIINAKDYEIAKKVLEEEKRAEKFRTTLENKKRILYDWEIKSTKHLEPFQQTPPTAAPFQQALPTAAPSAAAPSAAAFL